MAGGEGDERIVVVPHAPGPLVRPGGRRPTDGLDDLIDDLLPDTEEGPGLTDAALIAGGGAVVAWSVAASPPVLATVAGVAAMGLGCILPLRSGWRWVAGRRHAAGGAYSGGVPLRVDDGLLARLATAYSALDEVPATTGAARAAAHGAVLEVASLLSGRPPASEAETRYVGVRVTAVEELVGALRDLGAGGPRPQGPAADLVVAAREELDALGGVSALSRLDDVTAEIRDRGRHP